MLKVYENVAFGLMTPESNGEAPLGRLTSVAVDARAGLQVTVCGFRLWFRHCTAWPRLMLTRGGSKLRLVVIVTVAATGWADGDATAITFGWADGEAAGAGLGCGVAFTPMGVGGGPPGVGGGMGRGAAPTTGLPCGLAAAAGDVPGDPLALGDAAPLPAVGDAVRTVAGAPVAEGWPGMVGAQAAAASTIPS